MAVGSNVKTNIIWGCLWDETMQWLTEFNDNIDYGQLVINSGQWGNYMDATFTYNNGISNVIKPADQKVKIPTGSADYTKKQNIYDFSGNMWEWTLESSGKNHRVVRGGSYLGNSTYYTTAYRANSQVPSCTLWRSSCIPLYKIILESLLNISKNSTNI